MHGATLLLLLSGSVTQPATTPGSAVLGRSPLATFVLAAGLGVEGPVEPGRDRWISRSRPEEWVSEARAEAWVSRSRADEWIRGENQHGR